jgi:hypothetical protein
MHEMCCRYSFPANVAKQSTHDSTWQLRHFAMCFGTIPRFTLSPHESQMKKTMANAARGDVRRGGGWEDGRGAAR